MLDRKSLFKIRKLYRLTQEDVAKITRTSLATVSRIESGEQELSEGFFGMYFKRFKTDRNDYKVFTRVL